MKSKGRRELINEIKELRRELGLEEGARSIAVVRQKKEENRIAEKERRERQRREMLKGGANNGKV